MFTIWYNAYCFWGCSCLSFNLLLHYIIDMKWITLTELNHIIQAHHYSYTVCDTKLNTIKRGHTIGIKSKSEILTKFCLHNSWALQMMILVRLLPFIVGRYVERNDSLRECFLQLLDICSIVWAFEVTDGNAIQLAWLVATYLAEFFTL